VSSNEGRGRSLRAASRLRQPVDRSVVQGAPPWPPPWLVERPMEDPGSAPKGPLGWVRTSQRRFSFEEPWVLVNTMRGFGEGT